MPVSIPNITIPICLTVSGLLFMASGATFLLAAVLARRSYAPARSTNSENEWVTGYAFPEYQDAVSAARTHDYTGGRWTWRAQVFEYRAGVASTSAGHVVPCVYHPRQARLDADAYPLSYGARLWIRILGRIGAPFWWHWDHGKAQPPSIEERSLAWKSTPTA